MGSRKHWLLVADDCTNYCWSYFLKEKIDLKSHVIELINDFFLKCDGKVKCICEHTRDPDSRRNISGLYFMFEAYQPAIQWKSKAQHSVALPSSEAEWVAASEIVKEVMFVLQLLQTMRTKVDLPIIVYVDNVEAVFMANNITTTGCSKHEIYSANLSQSH